MTTYYGDFKAATTVSAEAYPISYAGSGLFNMSPLAEDMLSLIPSYYYYGNNNRKIMELLSVVLEKNQDYTADITDQFFVGTATWGLKYWEQLVGLPINDGSLDFETRRNAILLKLKDCSSKECFVEGIENVSNGRAIVTDLDPTTNPYQVNVELTSTELVYNGPTTPPTAAAGGNGNLNGDYTYRVTYEFDTVNIPPYTSLFPYGSYGGLFNSDSITPQRQFLFVSGTGSFTVDINGVVTGVGPFTELSTAQDVVDGINVALSDTYGNNAASALIPSSVIGNDGVLLVFNGEYSLGVNLPLVTINGVAGTSSIVNNAEFNQVPVTGETSSGVTPIRTNETQKISAVGSVTSGTFKIKYNTVTDPSIAPVFEETGPISYNANVDDIKYALLALPSIYPNSIRVTGGPLPASDIEVEFIGSESGYPQNLLMINNSDVLNGYFDVSRVQAGSTSYADSESNTVSVNNKKVILTNVPRSPDGALRRNIYRKKNEAYRNEWRYIGSTEDNYTTIFEDNVPDSYISETQKIVVFGDGTFKLKFDGETTSTISTSLDTGANIATKIEALAPTDHYATIDVSGSIGVVGSVGATIEFSGGDVAGKDVPTLEIVEASGVSGFVINTSTPRVLTERNTAFTYIFQRLLDYIYVTKPAHLRVRELKSAGFRAGINMAGDTV